MNKSNFTLLFLCVFLIMSCKSENAGDTAAEPVKTAASKDHPASLKKKPAQAHAGTDHMNTGGMQWMTIEEAEKVKNDGKKYLVDVYTDWCGWCKVMDRKTFSDPDMQKYLKDNFHVIKLNAEQKEAINFQGKQYEWVPSGRKGVNQLAVQLLGSRLSYPTIVYLDENMKKIKSSPGFKDPEKLMAELKAL